MATNKTQCLRSHNESAHRLNHPFKLVIGKAMYLCYVLCVINRWHFPGWSSCSKTCGHGVVTRKVECRMKIQNPGKYKTVSEGGCKESKPLATKPCFKVACPAEWVPSLWGEVNLKFWHHIGTVTGSYGILRSAPQRLISYLCKLETSLSR